MLPLNMRKALLSVIATQMNQAPQPGGFSYGAGGGSGDLVDIGRGFKLNSRAADAFRRAAADAQKEGIDLYGINNTYRSVQQQQGLWNQALQKYGSPEAARKWVAPPGQSNHNRGIAIDFSSRPAADWMRRRGGSYGFQNYAPEWWHYDYKG